MPGRKSVDKDGGDKSQPENAKHIPNCMNDVGSMGKIEHCQ